VPRSQNLSFKQLNKKLDPPGGGHYPSGDVGELYVSASEIETWDLCPRKWAFVYIEKKRLPPNESAALGTRVHAILEKWLRDGIAPDLLTDEGAIAASGLHLLPPPRTPGLVTEEEFHFTSRRAWYKGYKDFRYRDANGLLHVGDHKTTKAFTWAKSLEEILCHSQSLIYAVDEFHKNPDDQRIALDWVYYKTTGSRKAEPRFQIVAKEVVAEMFFEHVDPVAGHITMLHNSTPQGTSALEFAPDFRACDAFGGCPYLSICNPTPTQKVQAHMTQAATSLGDKLKALKAGRAQSPIHPPEHFAPPGTVQPPQQPSQGVGFQPPPQMPPGPQMQPAWPGQPAPVAPPPQGFALPTPDGAPQGQAPLFPMPAIDAQAAQPPPVPYQPPPVTQAAPPPEPVAPAEAPKKRGRPKGATSAVAEQKSGIVLYVGCAPIGSQVTYALEYINQAHDNLRGMMPISHYRELEFGKGPGELCKALENLLGVCEVEGLFPQGDVVLGSTQIEEDTASVWFSKAAKIVRAFR